MEDDMHKIVRFAIMHTQKGKICLLSPAAASYDQYENFEARGKTFKHCALKPFSLKDYNSFNIEAACNQLICINKEEEFDYLFEKKIFESPFLILGGGSNLLFTKDFNGTVIHINTKGIEIKEQTDDFVTVAVKSGENWAHFIDFCTKSRFFGVENLAGIPGKVGSSPVQNIGAYGVEVKEVIQEVHALEIATGKSLVFTNEACKFGYRDSIFKHDWKNRVIIKSVWFRLAKTESYNLKYKALREELPAHTPLSLQFVNDKIIEIRNRKLPNPESVGSAGSFFKNPVILKEQLARLQKTHPQITYFEEDENHVKLAAAQLIEICGWKGYRENDAGVYPHQPLVLVNYGNSTGEEIMNLSKKIQQSVFEKFDVLMECEVQMV